MAGGAARQRAARRQLLRGAPDHMPPSTSHAGMSVRAIVRGCCKSPNGSEILSENATVTVDVTADTCRTTNDALQGSVPSQPKVSPPWMDTNPLPSVTLMDP